MALSMGGLKRMVPGPLWEGEEVGMDGFVYIGGDWVGWQTEGIRPGNLNNKKSIARWDDFLARRSLY